MTPLLQSPALLLLAVGTLLGLNFPLGKLAQAAQVPAVLWAALISLGASTLLGAWLLLRRRPVVCDAQHARYFVITALVSYALPNLLVLAAMAHLGSGPTAMMFTLSPLFTALLSRLAGLRAPARLEYWGIAIGFGGALLVALARGEAGRPAAWLWVGARLLIPLLLALGNVYRSLDWPPRADGTWLAVGSHGVAALLLLALCALTGAWRGLPALAGVLWLAAAGGGGGADVSAVLSAAGAGRAGAAEPDRHRGRGRGRGGGCGAAGRALSAAGVGRRGVDRAGHRADGVGAARDLKGLKCY